jgi:RNA-directed DNA polymerase
VKGGRWFSLIDKVMAPTTLRAAFGKVKANRGSAGVDHVTVRAFEARLDENLAHLHRTLRDDTYGPGEIRRVWIPKPGRTEKRPLGVPTVRDRVVQTALRMVLEPIFERDFAEHSYGFRPGRGCRDALRRVNGRLRQGYVYVVDADLTSYFDTIAHEALMERVRARVADGRVLALVEAFLQQGVMDGLERCQPEQGTPQGAVISPLLSNLYLDALDHRMAEAGFAMTRYADDFVIQCRSEAAARRALGLVSEWVADAGLTLHPDKTRIVNATAPEGGGFDFLGYHFECGNRWPSTRSMQKLKDRIRHRTRRLNGHSMERIITDLNPILKGWYEYFKHSGKTTFRIVDGLVRRRLRRILRKRLRRSKHRRRYARNRGHDNQRWPNAYFAARGLFSLLAAFEAACPSVSR